jgi:uncharacterized membrane-anchored protein YitT (DUF2179 family)
MVMTMKEWVKNGLLLVIGNYILALSVGMFILPYNILSGGVAGIAVALQPFLSVSPAFIINVLVIGLFIIGAMTLGRQFAFSTAISSFLYPFMLTFTVKMQYTQALDPILASLYGGLLAGVGVGMVIRSGSSTGGMDVPPLVIHKYTHIEIHKLVLIVDALTVLLGFYAFGLEAVLIGFISVWACAFSLDKILVFGGQQAKAVYIISEHYKELIPLIHDKLDRGTTLLNATGGYTGENRPVILAVIMKNQYPELTQIIHSIDKHAFFIANETTEVKGYGFTLDYKV